MIAAHEHHNLIDLPAPAILVAPRAPLAQVVARKMSVEDQNKHSHSAHPVPFLKSIVSGAGDSLAVRIAKLSEVYGPFEIFNHPKGRLLVRQDGSTILVEVHPSTR